MAAGLLDGLGSERRLARSVAHRLKYYIEVQRKENSFQSSDLPWDEAENVCLHPAYLTEQRKKEHNFAKIKLEAFLRAYIGNAEECNRKVQGNLAKQKEVEKLIKKMTQDYVPDRINEVKMNSGTRQNQLPCSLSKLYLNAVPRVSPEEVKRLVSSASKLIVAATSKISPEDVETTQKCKKRAMKSLKSFSNGGHKKDLSTIPLHEKETVRGQQSQTKQNAKEIKRKIKASNGSSTSPAKSKKIVSTAAQNTQLKTVASSLDGTDNVGTHSCAPFKTKRQMSPSKAGENVSKKNCASRKPPATRPGQALGSKAHEDRLQRSVVLKTKEQKASKGNSARPSPTSAAKIYSNWHSTAGKKTRKQFGSEKISRSSILKRPSGPKPHQNGPREKLVKCRQKNRSPKDRRERGNSPSRTASKCHRVNWASDDDGGGDNATASYRKKCGLTGCTQEGRNGDGFSTVQPGTTFLHELCQEMAQEVPGDWTVSESNRSSSPKELGDARAGEDHVSSSQSQERVLEESCKQDAICIPLVAPAGCRCSELPNDCRCEIKEEQEMGFPGKTAALLKSLDKEQSEDEFTNSSLSSSGSSSSWFYEQMGENITLKEGINPKFLQKLLKAPKNGTVPQEVSHQYEKQK